MPAIHQLKDEIFWLHVWRASVVTWPIDILIGQPRPLSCYHTRDINKNCVARSKNPQKLRSEYHIIQVVVSRRKGFTPNNRHYRFFFQTQISFKISIHGKKPNLKMIRLSKVRLLKGQNFKSAPNFMRHFALSICT